MDNDAKLISFWELIEKTQVVIPIIQRDYAQGRTDPKSTAIRDRFLKDIKDALINNETELKLDFIYGQVSHDGVFEPLDGQQRLTTLFLLHWYLAVKDGLTDECQKLSNFSYHTRESARLFCERLVQWPYDPSADNRTPSEQIKDQTWFVHAWLQDPTVCAMLVMLDAIHATFKDTEAEFKHLHRIKFYKLDMQGYGATDDLYIKMNARGKPLTNFENLKASLSQFLYTEDSGDLAEKLMENIDNKWSKELFWHYKHDDMTFDDFAYNLFRLIFICEALLKSDSKNDDTAKTIIDAYLYTDMLKQKMITVDAIRVLQNAINGLLNTSVLQILANDDIRHFYGHSSDFKDLVNQTKISYAQILRFFVIYKIAARNDDQELMYQKLRIARNLINDVTEYNLNSASDLIKALCSLNTFINEWNIDECNSLNSDKILSIFNQSPFQEIVLNEENLKLSLIKDKNWQEPIYKAENHPYFKGQIGMILALAYNENTYNIRVFEHYYKILDMMFNEDGLNQEITGQEFLIERALLAFRKSGKINEQYLLPEGYNYSFLEANGRDTSWKRLMRGDREEQYQLFIDFINCIGYGKFDPSINNLKRKLDEIIDDFLADQCNQQDWRYYMVKFHEIIARCKNRYIRRIDQHNILLLRARQTNGYHDEYYSYAQYQTWIERGLESKIQYHDRNSSGDWKYIEIDGLKIAYDHRIGEFVKVDPDKVNEYEEFDPAEYKTFQLYGGFIPTPSKP